MPPSHKIRPANPCDARDAENHCPKNPATPSISANPAKASFSEVCGTFYGTLRDGLTYHVGKKLSRAKSHPEGAACRRSPPGAIKRSLILVHFVQINAVVFCVTIAIGLQQTDLFYFFQLLSNCSCTQFSTCFQFFH